MDFVNYLLPEIEHFQFLGYWVVLLVSLLESLAFVGLVVPGSTFIAFIGALSAEGYLDLGDLIWFATMGAILGDGISYLLGKKGKILFSEDGRFFKGSYLEKGEVFFRKHGAKSVFLGRFIGPIRPVIPFVAGLSRMDAKRFYIWNILSAILWASSTLLAGYFFGYAWKLVEVWSGRIGIFLAALALFLVCAYFLEKYLLTKGKQLFEFLKSVLTSGLGKITARPGVRSFVGNHLVFFAVLKNRLNSRRFSGLPLTLMGVAFLYILLVFMGIIEDIVNQETIVAVDARFESLLYVYRSTTLVNIFLWITLLGKAKIIVSLAAVLSLLFWMWRKRAFILPFWITICGSYLFIFLGKIVLHRQRPTGIGVYEEAFFAFPSGHATIAIAFYGFIAYFLIRQAGTWRNRLNLSFAAMALIAAIGFSRLYLGVHFLSDVLGGYLLGLLWLITGICTTELLQEEKPETAMKCLSPPTLRITTAILLLAEAGFYVHSGIIYRPMKQAPVTRVEERVFVTDILKVLEDNKLPKFTESITGKARKPLNIIIVADNDTKVANAMKKAGWQAADRVGLRSAVKSVKTSLEGKNNPSSPIAPAFWNGRANEMNFEKQIPREILKKRHEARLWKTKMETGDGKSVYVGLVNLAEGIRWWTVPKAGPDIDSEREELFDDLRIGDQLSSYSMDTFVNPVARQDLYGHSFFTDGRICIVTLR
jgi:undecaprenyl-diphosphatase